MGLSDRRSPVTSGAAAFAVVLVTVLVWWLLSGNGPTGPPGNEDRLATAEEPSPDGALPRSTPPTPRPDDRAVRIDGYVLEAPDRLALNYTTGVPACSGRLATPTVVEDAGGVTITLPTTPPRRSGRACIELAVMKTVRVTLESPLEGRGVLDGSVNPRVRVERVAEPYE
jgi:hypothetical protein